MKLRQLPFRLLGFCYRLLFLLPVVGEWIVRGMSKINAYMIFYSPWGPKRCNSVQELRKEFDRMMKIVGIEVEIINQDEERFEFVLSRCPYGFCRPGHWGVCDTAMDTDRIMFGLAGGRLVIDERIPGGAPECRISLYIK